MKKVILNRVEKARGEIGFVGESRTERIEYHFGVPFVVQPDGALVAEVEDNVAAAMVAAGRVGLVL
jgi:hypothetical protein